MKILHLYAGSDHGGAETFSTECIAALSSQENNTEHHVITRPFHSRIAYLRDNGCSVTPYGFRNWQNLLMGKRFIHKEINRFQPDIIQAWMGRAASITPKTSIPTIGWFGGYYDLKRYKTCDQLVGVTYDIRRHFIQSGFSEERSHCIHTFADLTKDDAGIARQTFNTPDDVPLLLVLSRLHWKKGIDTMLNALLFNHKIATRQKSPKPYLWIAGSGELEEQFKKLCHDLNLDEYVRFLGWQDARKSLLNCADICVLPSRYEPFGTVMVEAWQTQTPLIACKAQGPSEYVKNGENGLLCDIDDEECLAKNINLVLSDHSLKSKIIAGGSKSYKSFFSRDIIVKNYLALYEQTLKMGKL